MRNIIFLLLLSAGALSGYDIQPDAGPREPLRSEPATLSKSGSDKADAMAEFAAFLNGVISKRGKNIRLPEPVLDRLYLAVEKDPESEELLALTGADLTELKGQVPPRMQRLTAFAKQHPEHIRLNLLLVTHLARNSGDNEQSKERFQRAIDLIDAMWKLKKASPADSPDMERLLSARMLQSLLYASLEQFEKADEVISDVLERIPAKRRPEALQTAMSVYLEALKKASSEKPFLIGFLMESDKEKYSRKFEEASAEFIQFLSSPEAELDPEKFLTSAAIFGREGKTDYSLLILTRPLYADLNQLSALRRLAAFYYSNKQYANAARTWARIMALEGGRVPMDSYLHALSLLRAGNVKAAVKAFEEHYKRFPRDVKSLNQYAWAAWLAEEYTRIPGIVEAIPNPPADLLYLKAASEQNLKRYAPALESMLKFNAKQTWDNEEKRSNSRMQTVLLAEKAKRMDVVEKILLPMIEENPDDPELLNLLGYLYSEAGIKLDKALELLEKAVKAEPANQAILDSMAWVLYRRKEYGKALDYIKKALAAEPQPVDSVILDHAGDIWFALGDKKKALEYWKRSLEYYSPDLNVEQVLEKIRKAEK